MLPLPLQRINKNKFLNTSNGTFNDLSIKPLHNFPSLAHLLIKDSFLEKQNLKPAPQN